MHRRVRRPIAVEALTQIAVAEPRDQMLSAADELQEQRVLIPQRVQRPIAPAVLDQPITQRPAQVLQRHRRLDRGQPLQIPLVGRLREVTPPMQVGYPLAQRLPPQFPLRVISHRPIHLQAAGIMDRRLDPQHLPLLVIQLHAVETVGVLDPHPLEALLQIADDLPGERPMQAPLRRDLLLQEPQHIPAAEGGDPVVHQSRIQRLQVRWRGEHHVGGPLALLDRPVIVHRVRGRHPLGVHGVELPHQLAQEDRPVDLQLVGEQGLGGREILDRDEGIVLLEVADPRGIELPRQPIAAVEDDLDLERHPGLDAEVNRPIDRMVEVEVEVQALAQGRPQFEVPGLRVAMDVVTAAGLDATEHGDQPVGVGLAWGGETADEIFLALRTGGQVVDAPEGDVRASCSPACLIRWLRSLMYWPKSLSKTPVAARKAAKPLT